MATTPWSMACAQRVNGVHFIGCHGAWRGYRNPAEEARALAHMPGHSWMLTALASESVIVTVRLGNTQSRNNSHSLEALDSGHFFLAFMYRICIVL